MLKKLSVILMASTLAACSMNSVTSYIPFMNDKKPVINLSQDKIDQKSYATAYEATVQTFKGRVTKDFDVNSFASGANDWYLGRILVPIDQVKANLYNGGGHDSNVYAYYSGVVFASDLQGNFNKLSSSCWAQVDQSSATQGIYDAMLDLQKDKVRSENDEYIVQGSEQILALCTRK